MNTTNASTQASYSLLHFFRHVNLFVLPVVLTLGVGGNIFSIAIFATKKYRRISSSYYLSALALYDTLFLLGTLVVWIDQFDHRLFESEAPCRIVYYVLNVASNLSPWCVTAFTVERFIVVHYPLHKATICTPSKTRIILLALLPYPLLLNAPYLLLVGVQPTLDGSNETTCDVGKDYNLMHKVISAIDTVTSFLLPVIAIAVLNALIVRKMITYRKETTPVGGGEATEGMQRHCVDNSQAQKERSVTLTLLAISTVFALLNLPSYVTRTKAQVISLIGQLELWTDTDETFEKFANFLFYCNFAIDFVLYSVSSKNFRMSAFQVCRKALRGGRTPSERSSRLLTSTRRTGTTTTATTMAEMVLLRKPN